MHNMFQLARYINKYILKPEPSHLFNIQEGNLYREHVHARRMGSMEVMFLLLSEKICDSSVQVKYLVTDPPNMRSKCILPMSMISLDDDDPYWKDQIEKYFSRPRGDPFDSMGYKEYFERYKVKTSTSSSSNQHVYCDLLGNCIVQRRSPILIRYRHLQMEHGESYFYQRLLMNIPARSEEELKGEHNSYRDHYIARFPDQFTEIIGREHQFQHQQTVHMLGQYSALIENLFDSLQILSVGNIQDIVRQQLDSTKILPPFIPENAIINLPTSQYQCVQTITNYLGKRRVNKFPYFFITGSAGTGKSYVINILINELRRRGGNYLLMAPTGVAAQNIGGQTIHSVLRIHSAGERYQTLAFFDPEFKNELKGIDTIFIDEISMVLASLLSFISDLFSSIHNNAEPFGGINVIVVGDLAQLPPVHGNPVYQSPVWKVFYPLFLRQSRRQEGDLEFYELLEKVRIGNIDELTWSRMQEKSNENSLNNSV